MNGLIKKMLIINAISLSFIGTSHTTPLTTLKELGSKAAYTTKYVFNCAVAASNKVVGYCTPTQTSDRIIAGTLSVGALAVYMRCPKIAAASLLMGLGMHYVYNYYLNNCETNHNATQNSTTYESKWAFFKRMVQGNSQSENPTFGKSNFL